MTHWIYLVREFLAFSTALALLIFVVALIAILFILLHECFISFVRRFRALTYTAPLPLSAKPSMLPDSRKSEEKIDVTVVA